MRVTDGAINVSLNIRQKSKYIEDNEANLQKKLYIRALCGALSFRIITSGFICVLIVYFEVLIKPRFNNMGRLFLKPL